MKCRNTSKSCLRVQSMVILISFAQSNSAVTGESVKIICDQIRYNERRSSSLLIFLFARLVLGSADEQQNFRESNGNLH